MSSIHVAFSSFIAFLAYFYNSLSLSHSTGITRAVLRSPVYGKVNGKCEITFWYHKNGGTFSVLRLNKYYNVTNQPFGKWEKSLLWSVTKSFGDQWNTASVGIGAGLSTDGFVLEFEAIRLINAGDIAVDDITFSGCAAGNIMLYLPVQQLVFVS